MAAAAVHTGRAPRRLVAGGCGVAGPGWLDRPCFAACLPACRCPLLCTRVVAGLPRRRRSSSDSPDSPGGGRQQLGRPGQAAAGEAEGSEGSGELLLWGPAPGPGQQQQQAREWPPGSPLWGDPAPWDDEQQHSDVAMRDLWPEPEKEEAAGVDWQVAGEQSEDSSSSSRRWAGVGAGEAAAPAQPAPPLSSEQQRQQQQEGLRERFNQGAAEWAMANGRLGGITLGFADGDENEQQEQQDEEEHHPLVHDVD